MGDVMTFAAFRELGMHPLGVGKAVTVRTLGYRLVFVCVALNATDGGVLCLACLQHAQDTIVASATLNRRRGVSVSKLKGLMGGVAGLTVVLRDLFRMGLVAINALRNDTVLVGVAEVTGGFRVITRAGDHLLVL